MKSAESALLIRFAQAWHAYMHIYVNLDLLGNSILECANTRLHMIVHVLAEFINNISRKCIQHS